jgi:hypothetical protein
MLVNRKDWLRCLRIAASVDAQKVKFSEDGSFGVLSGLSFIVFGKSLFLGKEIAFLDISEVIRNLACFKDEEINVEVSEGKIIMAGDNDKVCRCRLAPPEIVPNYKIEDLPKIPKENWLKVFLQVEALYHLRDVIKSTRAPYVWFCTKDGRLTVLVKRGQILWEIAWEELNLPNPVGIWKEKLLACLNCLDTPHISLGFKFTGDSGILRIKQKDEFSGVEFTWFMGMLTEKEYEERQTQGKPRLSLTYKG